MDFQTPVEKIKYIGPEHAKNLRKLKIRTLAELLFYFPYKYEDFSNVSEIKELKIDEKICIKGKVMDIAEEKSPRRRMSITTALIQDKTGNIEAIWFNQPYIKKSLYKNDEVLITGKVTFRGNRIYLASPVFEKLSKKDTTHLGRIAPIYQETRGITSKWLRYMIKPLLTAFKEKIPETLPEEIIKKHKLLEIKEAIWQIHFPESIKSAQKAQERFTFEQLFLISLLSLKKRQEIKKEKAQPMPIKQDYLDRLEKSLPFKLTSAQEKVKKQILNDLERPSPMNRLLQGDVGSGKTVVAAIASLNVVKNKMQAVLMAPTEILAKQHFHTIFHTLKSFNLNVGILTGKDDRFYSKKLKNDTIEISRKKLLEKCEKGEIDVLIGTQALIVPSKKTKGTKVKFNNLGLVVIDEQHRFGTKQRLELCKENNAKIPHLLSMTATPIPRSLALTIWGDLDLSIIDELPKGRKKIETMIIDSNKLTGTYSFIEKEIKKGHQCFVICPRIEENEDSKLELKNVKEEYENLSKNVFPKLKVEMLHGKMPAKEKEKIMKDFKNKKFDILVSTSVIEVGIDIPNATIILIEGADRFGLAQLHQFRGRVGRGEHQSYCFLSTDSPNKTTMQRLKALEKYDSGFKLSEIDLKLRGPGDFSGVRQWGLPDNVMSALKNIKMVEQARETAKEFLPVLSEYPKLKQRLESFEQKIHIE